MKRDYNELARNQWAAGKFVCVGLDSDFLQIPKHLQSLAVEEGLVRFNSGIVETTSDLTGFYKPNIAFYEGQGDDGVRALKRTVDFIHETAPKVVVVGDIKRADIESTNNGYVTAAFDYYGFDAITVHPYLGLDAMRPFLDRKDKGVIVLCRTSNKGSSEFQGRTTLVRTDEMSTLCSSSSVDDLARSLGWEHALGYYMLPMFHYVAMRVQSAWNYNGNCSLVLGATHPHEMKQARQLTDLPFLIPGIGKQGGDLKLAVESGYSQKYGGMIINSSRGIIYASNGEDFAEAARRETMKLHDGIMTVRGVTV